MRDKSQIIGDMLRSFNFLNNFIKLALSKTLEQSTFFFKNIDECMSNKCIYLFLFSKLAS